MRDRRGRSRSNSRRTWSVDWKASRSRNEACSHRFILTTRASHFLCLKNHDCMSKVLFSWIGDVGTRDHPVLYLETLAHNLKIQYVYIPPLTVFFRVSSPQRGNTIVSSLSDLICTRQSRLKRSNDQAHRGRNLFNTGGVVVLIWFHAMYTYGCMNSRRS